MRLLSLLILPFIMNETKKLKTNQISDLIIIIIAIKCIYKFLIDIARYYFNEFVDHNSISLILIAKIIKIL